MIVIFNLGQAHFFFTGPKLLIKLSSPAHFSSREDRLPSPRPEVGCRRLSQACPLSLRKYSQERRGTAGRTGPGTWRSATGSSSLVLPHFESHDLVSCFASLSLDFLIHIMGPGTPLCHSPTVIYFQHWQATRAKG